MKKTTILFASFFVFCGWMATSCKKKDDTRFVYPVIEQKELTLVATSTRQWTGIAVSKTGRIFVNYPNWHPNHSLSVAELKDSISVTAYPDAAWNTIDTSNPATHFIGVQSVFIDQNDFLWILDAANLQREGKFLGVVQGGAKLLKVDLATNQVIQTIGFSQPSITKDSYLNDVRIDESKNLAYITDSGEGAILVVDLTTGKSRRVLGKDRSTKSENIYIEVEGIIWRTPDGKLPVVHSDGIALSPDRNFLYWRPLTGNGLWRIPTLSMNDSLQTDSLLRLKLELVNALPPSDGMIFGTDGKLYMTSLQQNGIIQSTDGKSAILIAQNNDLKWPDSFSNGPDNYLYVTTSQLHLKNPSQPYKIFKMKLK